MWQSSIESRDGEPKRPFVVSLNAWESDYYGDPLFAIVSGLADCVKDSGKSAAPLTDALKDVGWFATAISSQIANRFAGIDPAAAGSLAEEKRAARQGDSQQHADTFAIYEARKEAMTRLKQTIARFVSGFESQVLFLVDELDRCRPDYAISYLETIKHIFDIPSAVFILAADRDQLANSAKMAFGNDLDFDEYYRKFVHREAVLPPISDAGYRQIADAYVPQYLEREDLRCCFLDLRTRGNENITELIAGLRLTPRQIQEVFRILGHIAHTTEDKRYSMRWCLTAGTTAMAAFRVGQPRLFDQLGTQQLTPVEALNALTESLGTTYIDWWFTLFLTGGAMITTPEQKDEDILRDLGCLEEGTSFQANDWRNGWGWQRQAGMSRIEQIHGKITHIAQW